MDKSNKVTVISTIVLVGFVLGVVYHYILGFYVGLGKFFNTFLFDPSIAFNDFFELIPFVKNFAPYNRPCSWINYFPLAYILFFPFTLIKSKFLSYLVFASIFLSYFTYSNIKFLRCEKLTKLENFQNIFILTTLSYPVLFVLDRGNLDMLLFILFASFVFAFKSEKYLLSAWILAILNAIKPFTLIFLVLFLFKNRFKETFFNLIITVLLVIGGFMLLKGDFFDQISTLIINLAKFKQHYVYNNNNHFGMFNGSSLFMPLKLFFTRWSIHPVMSTNVLVNIYGYLSFFITAITIFFAYKEKTFWKQISILTLYMLLIPYLVNDYKLIFLFVPIWLFIKEKEKSNFDLAYAILFGLLLIPKNIVFLDYLFLGRVFSISIIINPIIMIIFMGLIIFEQLNLSQKRGKDG